MHSNKRRERERERNKKNVDGKFISWGIKSRMPRFFSIHSFIHFVHACILNAYDFVSTICAFDYESLRTLSQFFVSSFCAYDEHCLLQWTFCNEFKMQWIGRFKWVFITFPKHSKYERKVWDVKNDLKLTVLRHCCECALGGICSSWHRQTFFVLQLFQKMYPRVAPDGSVCKGV